MKHGSIITPRPRNLPKFARRTTPRTDRPRPVNWFREPADGDMLGNGDYGCCDPAADFRFIQKMGGKCDTDLVLNRYSQLTGFDKNVPVSDQGTDTNDDLRSWCAFPIFDGEKAFPIYWAQIEPQATDQIHRALERFPLLITVLLPPAVADKPERWKLPPPTTLTPYWEPRDAHRVLLGAWDGQNWTVETWGEHVVMHPDMLSLMLAGGIVDCVIPHPINAPEKFDLEGIDFDELTADLANMGLAPPG